MDKFKRDLTTIQDAIGKAFSVTGTLVARANCPGIQRQNPAGLLEKIATEMERAALLVRRLCEENTPFVQQVATVPLGPYRKLDGTITAVDDHWIHIQLNTLLPHCRYQSPAYLTDTLCRLLGQFQREHPCFSPFDQAVLIIDEHSDISGRHIYDQDNKGWKVVSNVIKGRLIPDDDQYHLSVMLLSQQSQENVTHITVLAPQELPDFISLWQCEYTRTALYSIDTPHREVP